MPPSKRSTLPRRAARLKLGALAAAALFAAAAVAQISVRPEDPSGLSLREKRVRVIHSATPEVPGTSMHLQQTDPWLAYQRGRSYFFHEWGKDEGVFTTVTEHMVAATTTSCGMCHNLPFRSPGAGGNTAEPPGFGRNTPHLFGAGLMEVLAQQLRAELLAAHDANRNGFLDVPAETAGKRAAFEATPGSVVDFGALSDEDGDRRPDLNPTVQPIYVDAAGRVVRRTPEGKPARLSDAGVVGYDVSFAVFSSSVGDHQVPTIRIFQNGALLTVMGVAADDPTLLWGVGAGARRAPEQPWSGTSNAGALQPNPELQPSTLEALARMQPDTPGTMGEGEVDLVEWYLLNHPAPALGAQTDETRRGRALLGSMGCTSCHLSDWQIRAADAATGLPGDRRFFHLEVGYDPEDRRLEGRLQPLTRTVKTESGKTLLEPRRGAFLVEDMFSDLRHHDLGERYHEHYHYQGRFFVLKRYRTPPLWGVGSTAPYGHDGRSPTLDHAIRRHGGEAAASTAAYLAAPEADRRALLAFLRSLVLYQPDVLPADLDGDGSVAQRYQVAGREVGPERFQPELLFRVPPVYRGKVRGPDGDEYFSYELLNLAESYGETLPALADANGDGLPDLLRPPVPVSPGR